LKSAVNELSSLRKEKTADEDELNTLRQDKKVAEDEVIELKEKLFRLELEAN